MHVDGVYIILEGPGGPLDQHFVPVLEGEEADLEVELVRAIQDKHWIFNEGDTIKFREGRAGLTVDQLRSHLYA
jgi:hypothetical protein